MQGTDVVGQGESVWERGVCLLVWFLTDVVVVFTNPLLAAAALGSDQLWPGAAPVGQQQLEWAQGHASHHAVHTGALVLAAGLEVLSVLVHAPIELAGQTLSLSSTQASMGVSSGPQMAA